MKGRTDASTETAAPSAIAAALWFVGGLGCLALALQTILDNPENFASLGSSARWRHVVKAFGAVPTPLEDGRFTAVVPLTAALGRCLMAGGIAAIVGGLAVRIANPIHFPRAALHAIQSAGRWFCLLGLWEALRLFGFAVGGLAFASWHTSTAPLWLAAATAGSLASFLSQAFPEGANGPPSRTQNSRALAVVIAAAACYFVVFTCMNWQLYRGLLVPHGDSAMYEEHLWNLLHGKGFRSYLDQGLFLGEHLQVIHALLIPLYWFWPSHLLLELCSSAALASGAVATFFIARRHSGSPSAGMGMAVAYLLAPPLQFLDIAIDLKTFRPTSFVIPLLLFALDQLERRRLKTMAALLFVSLSAQEDLALVIAPLGAWIFWSGWRMRAATADAAPSESDSLMRWGAAIAALSFVYLLLALTVFIPYFRQGHEVHYTSYFGDLGQSPGEIARSLFHRPGLLFGKLLSGRSLLYLVLMLLPYGFVSLRSPWRLLVAAPLFGVLCLMDTTRDPSKAGVELLVPFHHFHAPIVPIVVWAAAAGTALQFRSSGVADANVRMFRARFAACCAFTMGLLYSLSPLGLSFWDAGSSWHHRRLYWPGPRAEQFSAVIKRIPRTARVASTDFIHPRFTHHERSYDYSRFRRSVAGNAEAVPDDTDYIVIDTRHPYSDITSVEQVREWQTEWERWELLPDETDGYFIILRRRSPRALNDH